MSQHTTLVNLLSSIHSLSTPGISIHSPAPGTQDPDDIASASASGASSHTSIPSHSRRRHSSCAVWSPVSAQLHSLSGSRAPLPEQHMRVALHMRATPGAGLQWEVLSRRSAHAPVTGRASRHDRHTREADSDTPTCSGMFSMLRSSEDDSPSSPWCVHSLVRVVLSSLSSTRACRGYWSSRLAWLAGWLCEVAGRISPGAGHGEWPPCIGDRNV